LHEAGGPTLENIRAVAAQTGVPEADIYGVATFYHLLARPQVAYRVCQGLSCRIAGSEEVLARLDGAEAVSCLGQCDRPVPVMARDGSLVDPGERGRVLPHDAELPINLGGTDDRRLTALATARAMDPDDFLKNLETSGLQGRGGAGFPAAFKWRAVRGQAVTERYVVCNADEGEPGTFKDRECMLRRPLLVLEGLAIAAHVTEATEVIVYVRGAFGDCRRALEKALNGHRDQLGFVEWRFVDGHGAYICGEETALLESLEGRRGMPRLKPPYPTQEGFRGKPTLMHNVETIAAVPAITTRGGAWFRDLGRTEPGSKLYCISGHVAYPGVYELPLGVTLNELVQTAGGYLGTPRAFSPGGASSGFLPMSFSDTPLDFKGLTALGSMLGSAGVVVLDDTVDIADAAWCQAVFFEDESCGQCAPCRIGSRLLQQALGRYLASGDPAELKPIEDVAWEMEEGSICGLGIAAPLPIISAMKYFPDQFGIRRSETP